MYISLQLPFVDLRGLHEDALGRSPRPNWRADDPGECFIRNFGELSTRNSRAFGLVGERAYVESDAALVMPERCGHLQEGWPYAVPLWLWYRRLYFDGDISGRFEIGFNTDSAVESSLFEAPNDHAYDLAALARTVCDLPFEVRSGDGTKTRAALEKCGETLGLAYLVATTLHASRHKYPAGELMGSKFKVGNPSLHIRAAADTPIHIPHDRRDVEWSDEGQLFLTSVAKSKRRNTLTVQISRPRAPESPKERATRVLFSHLNSVLHANDFLSGTMDKKSIADQKVGLKDLTERALARFRDLVVTAPKTNGDVEFHEALKLFSVEHAGRLDEAVAKLEALKTEASNPSRFERVGGWVRGWAEFATNAGIEASVKAMMSIK